MKSVDFKRLFGSKTAKAEPAPAAQPQPPPPPQAAPEPLVERIEGVASKPHPVAVGPFPEDVTPFGRVKNAKLVKDTIDSFVPPPWAETRVEEVRGVIGYVVRVRAADTLNTLKLEIPVIPDQQGHIEPSAILDALSRTVEHLVVGPDPE